LKLLRKTANIIENKLQFITLLRTWRATWRSGCLAVYLYT